MRPFTAAGLTLPATVIHHLVAFLSEFAGTFLFLFFAFSGTALANTYASTTPPLVTLIFIAMSFGLSLTANVWAFYRVSGGMFNPVVTLALYLVGGLPAVRSVVVVVAQILGGMAAAGVVSGLYPGDMAVDTGLGNGTTTTQGLFIEVFLTTELVFVILMLAAEKHKATFVAPVGIGAAFFLTQLVGVHFTGGSLNPARSLGPAVVLGKWPEYFWIYVVGPAMGALLASGFYKLLSFLRWRECNPGQDNDDVERFQVMSEKAASDRSSY
ncbi:aquaporin-like protein [Cercophora newfieldiana]|uniref:Aquaporin-like protein n=1 Tax=Cercophora newfieldiana TaxID=92897 RepID=A0AA39YEF9_9PEZI|nr:aquaporin-like protein [Cercophora newfieldiana]